VLPDVRAELMDLQLASEWVVRLTACGLAATSEVSDPNILSSNTGHVTTSGDGATGGEDRGGTRVARAKLDEPELGTRWAPCLPTTSGDDATGGEGREEARAAHDRFDDPELDPLWIPCLPSGSFDASILFLSACRTDGTEVSDPLGNASDSRMDAFALADEEIDGDERYGG
jgi:hypothetical protein